MIERSTLKALERYAAGDVAHIGIRTDVRSVLAELNRLEADNAHLREEKRLVWDKANTPLGTCHDVAP